MPLNENYIIVLYSFLRKFRNCYFCRVSPFRFKKIFAYKRNKANLDPFHMCFTISLLIFTSLFSLLFAYFRFKFFASLHLSNFRFEGKQSEAKFKSNFFAFFTFFHFFSLFFTFFRIFFAFNFSLRFDLVIFASKRTKRSEIQVYFFVFPLFFTFFRIFSHFFHFFLLNFRFASIFSLNFRLFYLHFRFRFLVFGIEVNHVKSGFFFASKGNKIFASISNFASEAKVRAHPTTFVISIAIN